MENEFKKIVGQRGNTLLVENGFKFSKYTTLQSGETGWKCVQKNCKSKVYMLNNDEVFSRRSGEHNHAPAEDRILMRQHVNNSVKRKAAENFGERPAKMIRSEMSKIEGSVNELTHSDMKLISNSIVRARLKHFPPLPQSIDEVHDYLNAVPIKTCKGEDFLMLNDKKENMVIFSCDENLQALSKSDDYYMDGTFDFSAKYFTQFFVIHALLCTFYIPVVFCLIANKEKTTYANILKKVQGLCSVKKLPFSPKEIVIDFEMAIHSAIKSVCPDVIITGCRFHLKQAWWRKIQELGLTTAYKDKDSPEGKWLHHIFGLSFLHPDEVGDCIAFDFSADQPQSGKITKFMDYLVDTYISDDSIFPPSVWAKNSSALTKTTNSCESFHSRFNKSFSAAHPNIGMFVYMLLQMQIETYVKLNSVKKNHKRVIRSTVLYINLSFLHI